MSDSESWIYGPGQTRAQRAAEARAEYAEELAAQLTAICAKELRDEMSAVHHLVPSTQCACGVLVTEATVELHVEECAAIRREFEGAL